jgi:hypothetical protein
MNIHRKIWGLIAAALALAGCNAADTLAAKAAEANANTDIAGTAASLAKQCGIDVECKAGIVEGNASISGVASIDAFFASVLDFQSKADQVSADIDAKLDATRADFGIAADADLKAELSAQIQQNLESGVTVRSEPASCAVDTQAVLDAQAKCDASIEPATASVMCDGSCDVQADVQVDCGAQAELHCTINPPMGSCSGSCTGSCATQLAAAAKCDGICRGSCAGNCAAYADSTGSTCAGSCDGMCQGSCEQTMMAAASCTGSCSGECTISAPNGMCQGAVRAQCDQMGSAMVACKGRCLGQVVPPKAKAECEAHARAQAKLDVECTPPRLVLDYKLKADAEAQGQARFVAALENLRVRLPGLLATREQASSVVGAGADLVADAKVALQTGIKTAEKAVAKGDLRLIFGLTCAAREADHVADAVKDSSDRLANSVQGCNDVKDALGMD